MARQTSAPTTDETLALSTLTPDPRNARRHPDRNLALLEASLREVGAARSVVVDEAGMVLAGNATVAAASHAGITSVRVVDADGTELVAVRRTGLNPEQKTRLALLDNRAAELAEWDADALAGLAEDTDLSGLWDDDELAGLLAGLGDEPAPLLGDPDDVPDVPEEPVTRPGDLWLLGEHRLLCGDATSGDDVARLMDGRLADLVFTDPPYGVDYDGGTGTARKRRRLAGDVDGVYAGWLVHRRRLASARTPYYVWFAGREGRRAYAAVEEAGLHVRALIVWNKLDAHYGAYMAQYMPKHEPCLYCHDGAPAWYGPTNEVTVWDVTQPARNELHPTQKPVALAERAVANSSRVGDLVLDLFLGSGTTLVAAERLGRRCDGMELEPAYCDVVVARWEALTGKTAERVPAERDTAA